MSSQPLGVRTIPQTAPEVISADEACSDAGCEDVLGSVVPFLQDTLALDFFPPDFDQDDEVSFDRQPTRRSHLEDPAPFVAKMAQAITEIVAGHRPAPQLIRHTSPLVYSALARRSLVSARRQGAGVRRSAVVRRIRTCEPADGIVEACAVVMSHGRVRALAMRLEGLDGRWLITQLTIG